jgi:subtilisin
VARHAQRQLQLIVATAAQVLHARAASLLLLDAASQTLVFEVALGDKAEAIKQLTVPLGHGIAGLVAASGQAIATSGLDPRQARDIAELIGYLPRSIVCVPVVSGDEVLGVLELLDKDDDAAFSASDISSLELFAQQAALALEDTRPTAEHKLPAYASVFAAEALHTQAGVWPIDAVTREWAWGGSLGEGVKVAILDSGVDASHPAVGGPVNGYVALRQGPEQTPEFDRQPHADAFGHGTACASIVRSLAPACELYSVRVLGGTLSGKGSAFAAGLRWAIDNGMHVCNLSLGTTRREFYAPLHELSDLAYFRNVMLVAAANNLPTPSFPSTCASVISVATHTSDDPYRVYYNPRPPVEFGARGADVRVAWLNGGWLTTTGNSFAAPHMTGLVARILGKHPGLTVFQMKTILRALADNVG